MRKQQKIINLYGDKIIYAIKQIVSISDEEDLNQLWEYIMSVHLGEDAQMYAFLANLYELSTRFLETHKGVFLEIIIEQSDEYYYFTVINKEFIYFARKKWKKRRVNYKAKNKRMTIRLLKQVFITKSIDRVVHDDLRINQLLATVSEGAIKKERPAYTFIDQVDLVELLELVEDMNIDIHESLYAGLSIKALIRMRSYFSLVSLALSHYEPIKHIAYMMVEFSIMINQNKESFEKLNPDEIRLIEGFTHNIERWLRVLFIEGGAELTFMDRSLKADIEMIRLMIEPPVEASEDGLDAIFDF